MQRLCRELPGNGKVPLICLCIFAAVIWYDLQAHVSALGYLPHTPDQSILWLWSLHNTANQLLVGDTTEDPAAPKLQWPSAENCPTCRIALLTSHV